MFKVFSLTLSSVLLILANLYPVLRSTQNYWGIQEIMFFYWFELAIIGFFSTLKILITKDNSISKQEKAEFALLFPVVWFFSFVFSGFIIVTTLNMSPNLNIIWKATQIFMISHGTSFLVNFLINKEYLNKTIKEQIYAPVPQFIIIVLVFWIFSQSIKAPNFYFGFLLIVFFKSGLNFLVHLNEHGIKMFRLTLNKILGILKKT